MGHENSSSATGWWILSLSLGAVVIAVVVALLLRIIRAAQSIDGYASDIWDAGQQIAGNTASIWMLGTTNAVAGQILETAKSINGHAAAIDEALNPVQEPASVSGDGSDDT